MGFLKNCIDFLSASEGVFVSPRNPGDAAVWLFGSHGDGIIVPGSSDDPADVLFTRIIKRTDPTN